MIDTRIWICPKLCGCEISITADWVKEREAGRNVSYQHPKPFTITDIEIVDVCAEHNHFKTDPPITDETYGGEMRGYLGRVPNTEAEKLYIALTRYRGQRWKPDTCDCRIYDCVDCTNNLHTFIRHTKHTRKCEDHRNDDGEHTRAREENKLKNDALGVLKKDATLIDIEPSWSFNQQRNLVIRLPDNILTKTALATTIASELKTNRVIIG